MSLQITAFKNCSKWTQADEKLFWVNDHTPPEKQSNQDWNTAIHLKNNGPHIKVSLIFLFLIILVHMFLSPIVG